MGLDNADRDLPALEWQELTLAQLDFWEEFLRHPQTAVSTVAHAIEIVGPVDADALRGAIEATIAETDVMALCFSQPDPARNPLQCIDPDARPKLRLLDLSDDPAGFEAAMALMQADVDAPLDLRHQPIAAQWLIRLTDQRWIWYNRGHHIVLDGYAMGLIESRCAQIYQSLALGQPIGPGFDRFTDFLREEEDYRQSPRHEAAAHFWQDLLAPFPKLQSLQKGDENYPIAAREFELDLTPLAPQIHTLARELRCGWPDLLTALCAIWLQPKREDGVDARVIWLPFMSRLGSVSISVPAMVVNILPVPVPITPEQTLQEALCVMISRLKSSRRHGRYRIEQIAADRGLQQAERFFFSPLINIVPFDEPSFMDCDTHRHVLSNGPGDGFNLTIRSDTEGRNMTLYAEADPALTSQAAFDLHRDGLPRFLRQSLTQNALPLPLRQLLATTG